MKLLITLTAWLGCLLPYLASQRQQLLAHPIPKTLAWLGFVISHAIAYWGLLAFFDPITAGLVWLMLLSCMWVAVILLASHMTQRALLVSVIAVVVFSLILVSGGNHVA